jgi:dihydroneopterin aldolase
MALRAKWTVRIERLRTALAVGVHAHERRPQPVEVSVVIHGLSDAEPEALCDCLDYEPLCVWLTDEWPRTAHTPLLETRVNELLDRIFESDRRVQEAWVGVYKPNALPHAGRIGVERQVSRRQFETRHLARSHNGRMPGM